MHQMIAYAIGSIIFLITMLLTLKAKFSKTPRILILACGFFTSIGLCIAMARSVPEVVGAVSYYTGLLYICFM
jgi:hypothetical protein